LHVGVVKRVRGANGVEVRVDVLAEVLLGVPVLVLGEVSKGAARAAEFEFTRALVLEQRVQVGRD